VVTGPYRFKENNNYVLRPAMPYAIMNFVVPEKREVVTMKKGIHPEMYKTTITCSCGNVLETYSTKKDIRVELCSNCHPFYTGSRTQVEKGGRVERFKKKYGI
jgi:large subunit ribosomal protein L31